MNIHHYHHHVHHNAPANATPHVYHEHHQLLWKPYEFFLAILSLIVVAGLTISALARSETPTTHRAALSAQTNPSTPSSPAKP